MAARNAARYISRRFSSGGKILSEEEKAAENIYIKKIEKERLEKLAAQKEKLAAGSSTEVPIAEAAKPSQSSSTPGVSKDKHKNYAILAGVVTIAGALGWYALSKKDKEKQEAQD